MLINYARDDARRRITATSMGVVTVEGILGIIERQITENTWSYALLHDSGAAITEPDPETGVDRLIGYVRSAARRLGRRGPVAVVIAGPAGEDIARDYSAVEWDVGPVAFFRSRAEAETWLDRHSATPELLWTLRLKASIWSAELRDLGAWGVEVQVLWEGQVVNGRRFSRRALAEHWAEEERQHIANAGA